MTDDNVFLTVRLTMDEALGLAKGTLVTNYDSQHQKAAVAAFNRITEQTIDRFVVHLHELQRQLDEGNANPPAPDTPEEA